MTPDLPPSEADDFDHILDTTPANPVSPRNRLDLPEVYHHKKPPKRPPRRLKKCNSMDRSFAIGFARSKH